MWRLLSLSREQSNSQQSAQRSTLLDQPPTVQSLHIKRLSLIKLWQLSHPSLKFIRWTTTITISDNVHVGNPSVDLVVCDCTPQIAVIWMGGLDDICPFSNLI